MRCEQARSQIGMLIDGELPASDRDAVIDHTAGCAECTRYRNELGSMRSHLKLAREAMPARLPGRVSARLAIEAADAETNAGAATGPPRTRSTSKIMHRLLSYLPQAAVILLACAISIAGTAWWIHRTDVQHDTSHDVIAAHVRSLLQESPVQIGSLDTHTVKPWFAGRLEYSPVVKDLSTEGFQLVGGRLDYVDGQRVAALVYKRRLHQISVFTWPVAGQPIAPYSARIDGYSLLGWSKAGMVYWAASDLNEGELRELQGLL
jgi:anti-sigma factor RsiW